MQNKRFRYSLVFVIILIIGIISIFLTQANSSSPLEPTKVELVYKNNQYRLFCNGQAFYVKGAGLGHDRMESLAKHGANSFRTWSVNNKRSSGKEILDEAYKLGLMVSMGIDVGKSDLDSITMMRRLLNSNCLESERK